MSEFRYRDVETADGVTLNVVESGDPDGPPMVFVHGLASSWKAWEDVMAAPELAGPSAAPSSSHGSTPTAARGRPKPSCSPARPT